MRGRLNSTTGRIVVTDDPMQSSVDVRIETASLDTQNTARDADLRSERYLSVETFPAMTFIGLSAQPGLDATWNRRGKPASVRSPSRDAVEPVPRRHRQFIGLPSRRLSCRGSRSAALSSGS